jgi:hypothetical protein
MKIVLNENKVAVFFETSEAINLTPEGCYIGAALSLAHTTSNSEIIDVEPPEFLEANLYRRDGDMWVPVVDDFILERLRDKASDAQREARKAAYAAEADPLFFKWQRGEATQAEWLEKVAAIRHRYPSSGSKKLTGEIPVSEL